MFRANEVEIRLEKSVCTAESFPKKEKGLLAFFVQSQAFDVVVYRRVALARSE